MHDIHFICIQEARSSEDTRLGAIWYRIATGCAKHSFNASIYGTELWINLALPINTDINKPIHLKAAYFTIIYTDPRLMVVNLDSPHMLLRLIVGNAPHWLGNDSEVKKKVKDWRAGLSKLTDC